MGKFSDYDLPERKYDFHTDLKYGKQGEELVSSFLDAIGDGAFEVKTDRYRNGRMCVEIMHWPRKRKDDDGKAIWESSGLRVTKARWWVYVYTLDGHEGSFTVVSVPRLKRYLAINADRFNDSTMRDFARASSNPSRGFLLEPDDVMDLMINKAYDEVRAEE